jgi:hypothetical protein
MNTGAGTSAEVSWACGATTPATRAETSEWENRNARLTLSRHSDLRLGAMCIVRFWFCLYWKEAKEAVGENTLLEELTPLEESGRLPLLMRFSLLPLLQQAPPVANMP